MATKPGDDQIAEEISRVVNSGQHWSLRVQRVRRKIAETESLIPRFEKSKDAAGRDYAERRLQALQKAEQDLLIEAAAGPHR